MRAFKTVRRIEPDWHYTEPRPYRADAWAEAAGADDAPAPTTRRRRTCDLPIRRTRCRATPTRCST